MPNRNLPHRHHLLLTPIASRLISLPRIHSRAIVPRCVGFRPTLIYCRTGCRLVVMVTRQRDGLSPVRVAASG